MRTDIKHRNKRQSSFPLWKKNHAHLWLNSLSPRTIWMSKVMLAKLLSQKKWSLGPFLYWIKICAISFSFWPCHLPQRVNMSKLPFLRPSGLASYEISKSVRGSITHFCYFWVVYHGNVITNEYCHQKHQNVQYTCLMAEERLRLSWRFLRWVVGIGGHGFFSRGEDYFVNFFKGLTGWLGEFYKNEVFL